MELHSFHDFVQSAAKASDCPYAYHLHFELQAQTHVLAYNRSIVTCQNITRHMIWDAFFFRSTAQTWKCFQNWAVTLLCNQLVPLPFQPHCKSLPSLDRQTVPCLHVFQLVSLLFEEKQINSHIHKCKMNTCLPYYTLQICVLQLCSEAGSWGVSHSSGRCQGSLSGMVVWDMRTSKGKTGLPWK